MLRTHRPMARVIAPALGVLALVSLASCSSDDDKADKTTTTVETTSTTTTSGGASAATVAFDKEIQQELQPARSGHRHAPPVPVVKTEHHRIGSSPGPAAGRMNLRCADHASRLIASGPHRR